MRDSTLLVWIGWIIISVCASLSARDILLFFGMIGIGILVGGIILSENEMDSEDKKKGKKR